MRTLYRLPPTVQPALVGRRAELLSLQPAGLNKSGLTQAIMTVRTTVVACLRQRAAISGWSEQTTRRAELLSLQPAGLNESGLIQATMTLRTTVVPALTYGAAALVGRRYELLLLQSAGLAEAGLG
ncbi:hypothetical protein [Chloroflexus sp.]|uniref:hypothetical protein n=1 Tax=Chloroflexus sp. TaxID=1904827 RepID=UPI00404ACE7B